jgi:hypothetical protein
LFFDDFQKNKLHTKTTKKNNKPKNQRLWELCFRVLVLQKPFLFYCCLVLTNKKQNTIWKLKPGNIVPRLRLFCCLVCVFLVVLWVFCAKAQPIIRNQKATQPQPLYRGLPYGKAPAELQPKCWKRISPGVAIWFPCEHVSLRLLRDVPSISINVSYGKSRGPEGLQRYPIFSLFVLGTGFQTGSTFPQNWGRIVLERTQPPRIRRLGQRVVPSRHQILTQACNGTDDFGVTLRTRKGSAISLQLKWALGSRLSEL